MVNSGERLQALLYGNKPKELTGLDQKVRGTRWELYNVALRGQSSLRCRGRTYVTQRVINVERGNPVFPPWEWQGRYNRKAYWWGCGLEKREEAKAIL